MVISVLFCLLEPVWLFSSWPLTSAWDSTALAPFLYTLEVFEGGKSNNVQIWLYKSFVYIFCNLGVSTNFTQTPASLKQFEQIKWYLPHLLFQVFKNHWVREKSIRNASLAVDVCSMRMLTSPRASPAFLLQRKGTKTWRKNLTDKWREGGKLVRGRSVLCWMFINYLRLQAECTIVLSETLTFSISLRFGASYKVHCEKGVLTLRMIWRTEIPLSFIIYPGWPRGESKPWHCHTWLANVRSGHLVATLGNQSPLLAWEMA